MAGTRFLTRVLHAVSTPLVHKATPVASHIVTAIGQLIAATMAGGFALLIIYLAGRNGIPATIIKPVATVGLLLPFAFALLVVVEQIRITYARPLDAVYPEVEVFPDREPI